MSISDYGIHNDLKQCGGCKSWLDPLEACSCEWYQYNHTHIHEFRAKKEKNHNEFIRKNKKLLIKNILKDLQ